MVRPTIRKERLTNGEEVAAGSLFVYCKWFAMLKRHRPDLLRKLYEAAVRQKLVRLSRDELRCLTTENDMNIVAIGGREKDEYYLVHDAARILRATGVICHDGKITLVNPVAPESSSGFNEAELGFTTGERL